MNFAKINLRVSMFWIIIKKDLNIVLKYKKNGINNKTELFKCQDCGIEIAKNSKDIHLSVCKHKFINYIKDLEQKIIERDLLIFELKSELNL